MGQSRLFSTAAFAVLALSTSLRAEGVHWQTNIEQARKLAAESDRLVLLHFWGSNCGPCMRLEKNVFPLPQFAATLEANYVPVKIFADNNEDLVEQYHIRSWPTDVIMTPEGKVLRTGGCPQDPREYTQLLYQVAGDYRQSHVSTVAAQRPAASSSSHAASPQQVAYDSNQGPARSYDARESNPSAASSAPAVTARAVEDDRPVASVERRYAEDDMADASSTTSPNQYAQQRSAPPTATAAPAADRSIAAAPAKPSTKMPDPSSVRSKSADRNALPYGDLLPKASAPEQPPVTAANTIAAAPPATQGSPIASSTTGGDVSKTSAMEAAPTLCLDGCCPVTLKETKKWVAGDQRWGAVHRGRIYIFANEAAQQRFLLDPDAYTPAASGHDAVAWVDQGKLVPGVRKYGGYFRGQVYLFSSEETLQQFQRNSDRYAVVIEQAMTSSHAGVTRR